MLGSPVLDLAIGMAFIYLLLSLIATVIQEILATITQARSANLQRGVYSLFSGDPLKMDPDGKARQLFVHAIYAHGLIRGLYQDPDQDRWIQSRRVYLFQRAIARVRFWIRSALRITPPACLTSPNDLLMPAYIPARTFALALVDLLDDKTRGWDSLASIKAHLEALKEINSVAIKAAASANVALVGRSVADWLQAKKRLEHSTKSKLPDVKRRSKQVKHAWEVLEHSKHSLRVCQRQTPELVRAARKVWAEARHDGHWPPVPKPMPEFRQNKAVQALLTLLEDADGDPNRFQTNIENWYNDSMDRVSGWYKRYVGNVLLFIGLAIAVFFNVDSVRVARTLWFDHEARQGLASAAASYVQSHPDFTDPLADAGPNGKEKTSSDPGKPFFSPDLKADSKGTPEPKALGAAATDGSPGPKTFDVQRFKNGLDQTVDTFNKVSQDSMLPVGWHHGPDSNLGPGAAWWRITLAWFLAVVGWLITAGALSLGAPFWFDTLNKFMVVRNTIKPSEKSPNEKSKD